MSLCRHKIPPLPPTPCCFLQQAAPSFVLPEPVPFFPLCLLHQQTVWLLWDGGCKITPWAFTELPAVAAASAWHELFIQLHMDKALILIKINSQLRKLVLINDTELVEGWISSRQWIFRGSWCTFGCELGTVCLGRQLWTRSVRAPFHLLRMGIVFLVSGAFCAPAFVMQGQQSWWGVPGWEGGAAAPWPLLWEAGGCSCSASTTQAGSPGLPWELTARKCRQGAGFSLGRLLLWPGDLCFSCRVKSRGNRSFEDSRRHCIIFCQIKALFMFSPFLLRQKHWTEFCLF